MVNPYRGDVALDLNGTRYVLRLTLGALAELEQDLDTKDLFSLIQRFETHSFSARDLMALLLAGLRGGGATLTATDLAQATLDGGPIAATQAGAELLARSFAAPAP